MKTHRVLAASVAIAAGVLLSGCVSGYGPRYDDDYPGADGQSMYSSRHGHWERQPYFDPYVRPAPVYWERRVYRSRPVYGVPPGYYRGYGPRRW
jgi:hypothetical protein